MLVLFTRNLELDFLNTSNKQKQEREDKKGRSWYTQNLSGSSKKKPQIINAAFLTKLKGAKQSTKPNFEGHVNAMPL